MLDEMRRVRGSAPSLVCVCVDTANMAGRLYHKYEKEAVPFRTVSELLDQMDELFDRINYPQSSTKQRTFFATKDKRETQKEAVQMADTGEILGHSGDKATFIVHVRYRQNATWQGDVLWAEKKDRINFRSALELLKLMDSALDEAETETIENG